MKKSKAGIVTATVLIVLLVIVVLAEYLYSMRIPTYDEHGKIVAVTLSGVGEEYHAYKEGDGQRKNGQTFGNHCQDELTLRS